MKRVAALVCLLLLALLLVALPAAAMEKLEKVVDKSQPQQQGSGVVGNNEEGNNDDNDEANKATVVGEEQQKKQQQSGLVQAPKVQAVEEAEEEGGGAPLQAVLQPAVPIIIKTEEDTVAFFEEAFWKGNAGVEYMTPANKIAEVLAQKFPYHSLIHARTVQEIAKKTVAEYFPAPKDAYVQQLAHIVGLYHDIAHAYFYNTESIAKNLGLKAKHCPARGGWSVHVSSRSEGGAGSGPQEPRLTSPQAAYWAVMGFMATKLGGATDTDRYKYARQILDGTLVIDSDRLSPCRDAGLSNDAYGFDADELKDFLAGREYKTPDFEPQMIALMFGVHNGDMGHLNMKYGFCGSLNLWTEINMYGTLSGFLPNPPADNTFYTFVSGQVGLLNFIKSTPSMPMALVGEYTNLPELEGGFAFVHQQYKDFKQWMDDTAAREENPIAKAAFELSATDAGTEVANKLKDMGCNVYSYDNGSGTKLVTLIYQEANQFDWLDVASKATLDHLGGSTPVAVKA